MIAIRIRRLPLFLIGGTVSSAVACQTADQISSLGASRRHG